MKVYCYVSGVKPLTVQSIWRIKNKLLCKNPKCVNTRGAYLITNHWSYSCFLSSQTRETFFHASLPVLKQGLMLKHPGDDNLPAMMAILICQAAWPDTNWLSSCNQRSERLSPSHEKGIYTACSIQHSQPYIASSLRMKWMTCLALNVSLMGQQVPIWVSSAVRLKQRRAREREKKTSYQEIGNWVRQGITCHSRSKLPLVFPQRRAPHYQLRLISLGVYCLKGNMI